VVDVSARNSFSFFVSYIEAIEELPEKEQLAVLKAIIKYALYDEMPLNFKGIKQAVFLLVKPTLDKSKQKSASGKQGGSKRKQTGSKPEANGKQSVSDISEGIGVGEGIGKGEGNGEGDKIPRSNGTLFTAFWNAYPEAARNRREESWEAWKKLNPDREKAEHILQQLEAWKQSSRWLDDGGAFIPSPVNFLSSDRGYLTAVPPPQREAKNIAPKGASGELGVAELEAIQRVLRETEVE
jgi:hypothetical protein